MLRNMVLGIERKGDYMKSELKKCVMVVSTLFIIVAVVLSILLLCENYNRNALDYFENRGFEIKGNEISYFDVWIGADYFIDYEFSIDDDDVIILEPWTLNPDKFPLAYLNLVNNSKSMLTPQNVSKVKGWTEELNDMIFKANLNGIKCVIYFYDELSDENAYKYVEKYGDSSLPYHFWKADGTWQCEAVGLFVKDEKAYRELLEDENVCIVDPTEDFYFFGVKDKEGSKRNVTKEVYAGGAFRFTFRGVQNEGLRS